MELKYIAEGGSIDLGGAKEKTGNRNYYEELLFFDADKRNGWEQELFWEMRKKCFSQVY